MNITELVRDDRIRIEYGEIAELAESIFQYGLIHPITISTEKELIAGGRRSQALDYILKNKAELSENFTPHSRIVTFVNTGELEENVHYTMREVSSTMELRVLELTENVQRKNFSWQEEVQAIERVHLLKSQEAAINYETWFEKNTGRLFNVHRTNVNYCLRIANELRDLNSPIWKCSGVTEAIQYLAKCKLDEAQIALSNSIKERAATLPAIVTSSTPIDVSQFIQTFDPTKYVSTSGIASPTSEFSEQVSAPESVVGPATPPAAAETERIIIPDKNEVEAAASLVSSMIVHTDCVTFLNGLGKESVDCIMTDPPYGIDMANLSQPTQGQKNIDRIADTHDVKDNESQFESWLQACYDALKDKRFCVWWCDISQWQKLYDLAIKVGFKVQSWPFVWVKTSPCKNGRAEYNFTKNYEFAMIMRKGDARLVTAQTSGFWLGGLSPEDKTSLPGHPFIKPQALWTMLLKAVTYPGSFVVDPFSGVGSLPRAAMLADYKVMSCEIDEKHYAAQVHNLIMTYCKLKGIEKQ